MPVKGKVWYGIVAPTYCIASFLPKHSSDVAVPAS